jgi:hypothetical protein
VSDEAPAPETPEPGGDLWWLALGAYALGVTFLLPVTAVAYPLVSGEWWLLPALIVPWLASVLLGMPLLDSPKQLGVWPLLGTILGIFMLISQAAERLAS